MKVRTSVLLALVTGKCIGIGDNDNGLDDLQQFLTEFTGHDCYTHDLLRLPNYAIPHVVNQYPWLKDIDPNSIFDRDSSQSVKQQVESQYGKWVEIQPMPSGLIPEMTPIESLKFVAPDKDIYVINTGH